MKEKEDDFILAALGLGTALVVGFLTMNPKQTQANTGQIPGSPPPKGCGCGK